MCNPLNSASPQPEEGAVYHYDAGIGVHFFSCTPDCPVTLAAVEKISRRLDRCTTLTLVMGVNEQFGPTTTIALSSAPHPEDRIETRLPRDAELTDVSDRSWKPTRENLERLIAVVPDLSLLEVLHVNRRGSVKVLVELFDLSASWCDDDAEDSNGEEDGNARHDDEDAA